VREHPGTVVLETKRFGDNAVVLTGYAALACLSRNIEDRLPVRRMVADRGQIGVLLGRATASSAVKRLVCCSPGGSSGAAPVSTRTCPFWPVCRVRHGFHGSTTVMPVRVKSPTVRVAKVAWYWRQMAAICASSALIGRPARRRAARRSA
jgi:hypothetical protein